MKRFIWLEECKRFSATNQDVGRYLTSLKWYREHADEVQAALEQLKANLPVPSNWEVRILKLPKLPRLRMQIFNLHMPETDDKRAIRIGLFNATETYASGSDAGRSKGRRDCEIGFLSRIEVYLFVHRRRHYVQDSILEPHIARRGEPEE